MHTIIINTMGSELRQNRLFYLPFPAERFHWIEKPLGEISQCSEEIAVYHDSQGKRNDYHLILLVSLAQLNTVEVKAVREIYVKLLRKYLIDQFLYPLCQNVKLPPKGVSVVFMLNEKSDGTGGVPEGKELDHIFGFQEITNELSTLFLRDKSGNPVLDFAGVFQEAVKSYNASLKKLEEKAKKDNTQALNQLREHLTKRIHGKLECQYIPVGREETVILNCDTIEFAPLTTEWDMCCVDLQLNLCEHLQQHLNDAAVWRLTLTPHEPGELRRRILLAIKRVEFLEGTKSKLAFFDIHHTPATPIKQDITDDIWDGLNNNTSLPGMKDVKEEIQHDQDQPEEDQQDAKSGLGKELRKTWLMIGREKKLFEAQCEELQKQYEPETVNREQKEVLDTCAQVFHKWREIVLNREENLPTKATVQEMTPFNHAECSQKLEEAHQKWGTVAAEQLEDYEDVHERAEKIKAKFRKIYRLWPDGEFNGTSKFLVYSVVLAVLFVLQLLLPYIFITMGQDGVQISRYVHFIFSLLTFVVLYGVGVLLWMRGMCKKLHQLTCDMYQLLQTSHRRRRDSIARAVELYGAVLPRCTVVYEQQQRMLKIHEKNLQRKERFNTHEWLLDEAKTLLDELQTQLRLVGNEKVEKPDIVGGIDYEKPPSDEANVPYYVFMSEKWGKM